MFEILILACLTALGVLILIFKFARIRRILAFDVYIDIFVTISLCFMMAGTFSGVIIALIAGTIISVTLWFLKLLFGTERLTLKGWSR
jgi:hypothetical protein